MNTAGHNDKRYDDIIHLPHHVSNVHPPMAISVRAAQFLPFAALSGFEGAIRETGRLTEQRVELEEDARALLDEKLMEIQADLARHPKGAQQVKITFFVPDERKEGGTYITVTGGLKRVDTDAGTLVMQDGRRIAAEDILDISFCHGRQASEA